MNTNYLSTLPEVKNKFKVELQEGEKVIFTAKPYGFSSDTGDLLGYDKSKITLTNKRILADNGNGLWITDIGEDVTDMVYGEDGKGWNKTTFVLVSLNKEITYGIGIQKLNGYRFHFKKKDMAAFLEIAEHMK